MLIQMRNVVRALKLLPLLFLAFAVCATVHSQAPSAPGHVSFRVEAGAAVDAPLSGRLLIFVKKGSGDKSVDASEMNPGSTWVAAREVEDMKAGDAVEVNGDEVAFPGPASPLPPGDYEAQAVLDVDHNYSYVGRATRDWASGVIALRGWKPGSPYEPVLVLDRHPEEDARWAAALERAKTEVKPGECELVEFESELLTRFWGRPVKIRAWVILPPGYAQEKAATYPTAGRTDLAAALTLRFSRASRSARE